MASPPPIRHSFTAAYRDEPAFGSRPDSRGDNESYFEGNLPAPHRMSGFYPSASPSAASSVEKFSHYGGGSTRGSYLSPAGAVAATHTVGLGLQNPGARSSEISMVGLGTNRPRQSTWLEKEQKYTLRNRRGQIIACSIILLLVIMGIVLGVVLDRRPRRDADVANANGTTTTTAGVVDLEDPNDPSSFTKDSRLHNSLYGLAYTMADALYPDCHQSLAATIEDMQLMSQLTTRIRLYGADCNQTALVLEAIRQTKVDMMVFPAIFVVDGDDASYERQKTALRDALETYGTDHVEGITVGNEFMLNYVLTNGATSAESAIGRQGARLLIEKIDDTREMLREMGLTIPVGSSDAGSFFNTDLLEAIDYGLSNVHPWFAEVSVDTAADWTFDFFEDNNVAPAALLANTPQMYLAETGWPSGANETSFETLGEAVASTADLQTFIDAFVCQANTDNIHYFFFEYQDVRWKDLRYGGVEGYWGLFDQQKKLKDIEIPTCAHN